MFSKRYDTIGLWIVGISQAAIKTVSPLTSSIPDAIPPIGPSPGSLSQVQRTMSGSPAKCSVCFSFLATITISSAIPEKVITRREINEHPLYEKKYFSRPFTRFASPPAKIIADLIDILNPP